MRSTSVLLVVLLMTGCVADASTDSTDEESDPALDTPTQPVDAVKPAATASTAPKSSGNAIEKIEIMWESFDLK